MNSAQQPERQKLVALSRLALVMALLLFVLISATAFPSLFIRQTAVVTITMVDTARDCRKRVSRRLNKIWPEYRSSTPQNAVDYCGLIMSDHGSFELPQTAWLHIFGPSRGELHDALFVGCKYRVLVTGPGIALEKGNNMSTHNRTLRRAVPQGRCPAIDKG